MECWTPTIQVCVSLLRDQYWNSRTLRFRARQASYSLLQYRKGTNGGRSPIRVPDEVDFFNLPNPSNRTMALGSTQPLTDMSTRNFPGGKKRSAHRDDNLAAIYEPNV
jgi:hypothetical protein